METRLLVAYTLIAVLALIGTGGAIVARRQRLRRRRRLRGIKDEQAARGRRHPA